MKLPAWLRRALFWLSLVAGAAAFAAVLHYYDLAATFEKIRAVGWPCILATTATASMTLVIPAIGWLILLRAEGVRANPWTVLKANLMGFVLNIITPSLYLGGEPLKTFYVAGACGASKRRVLATIVVSKFQEFVGIVLALLLAVFFFVATNESLSKLREVTLVVLALAWTAGLLIILYAVVGRLQPTVWAIDQIARLKFLRGRLHTIRRRAVELEYRIYAAFIHRWKKFLVAQAVTLLSAISMFLRPVVFMAFLPGQHTIRFDSLCMIYVISNVINMLQIVPAGLGMQEWGITYTFDTQLRDPGFGHETALAFVLVGRFADVVLALSGLLLLWTAGLMRFARSGQPVPMEEPESPESAPVPDPRMKVLRSLFLAAHHEPTGKTRLFVGGKPAPRPTALRIAHIEGEEGFHLLAYGESDELMTDTFHRTLEEAMHQAQEEFRARPAEWEEVKPL
jgi:uncharacterized protein (TIRG00374 family)